MNNRKKPLVKMFLILLFCGSASGAEVFRATIRGRIVDEKGRPVKGVDITYDNSDDFKEHQCGLKNNEVYSDQEGRFTHEEHCGLENRTLTVFFAPTLGFESAVRPIRIPFWTKLRQTDTRFAGIEVKLHGNHDVDLGDIPLSVWYNRIELFVKDGRSTNFYKSEDDWANFWLIVRDEAGNAVGEDGLSVDDLQNKVRIDRGSVDIALPEGSWTLELLKDLSDFDNSGRTLSYLAKTTVRVRRRDRFVRARLVVSKPFVRLSTPTSGPILR